MRLVNVEKARMTGIDAELAKLRHFCRLHLSSGGGDSLHLGPNGRPYMGLRPILAVHRTNGQNFFFFGEVHAQIGALIGVALFRARIGRVCEA